MTHRASLERMLKAGQGRWVDLDGATYATNGCCAVLVDDPGLVAWLRASHETRPELAGLARVIANSQGRRVDPTDILTDATGQTARLFAERAPAAPMVAVDTRWLTPYNGKHAKHALAGLDWWYGVNAVSGWKGDVCHVVAMRLLCDDPLGGHELPEEVLP